MASLVAQAERLRKLAPPKPVETRHRLEPEWPLQTWEFFGLEPYPHQAEAFVRKDRFLVDVWHRRAGKSVEKIIKLIDRAVVCPIKHGRYAYLAPTYSQAQDIAWAELRRLAEMIPDAYVKDSLMAAYIPAENGTHSRIRLYGVDSPKQRLRGSYLDGVVLDEFQHIPVHVWTNQVRPMLADKSRNAVDRFGRRNQWANFIGTPLGRNHLYQFYDRALRWSRGEDVVVRRQDGSTQVTRSDQWGALHLPVSETNAVPEEELREIRADLSPTEYAQEFECDFDAGVEGAIFKLELAELKARGGVLEIAHNPYLPVYTAWDLGWNDMTVVWFFQIVGNAVLFIDYLSAVNASIPRMAELVKARKYRLGVNYFPHDVEVHEQGSGKTRASQYREVGILPTTTRKVLLPDGIAATRRLLTRASFDSVKCAEGLDLLSIYRREKDPHTGLVKQEPVHDASSHVADALKSAALGVPRWTGSFQRDTIARFS